MPLASLKFCISHIHRIGKKADTAIGDIVDGIPAWKGMVLEAGCFRVISGQIRAEGTVVEMNPAVIIDHRITKLGSPAHRVNHGHAKLLHQAARSGVFTNNAVVQHHQDVARLDWPR